MADSNEVLTFIIVLALVIVAFIGAYLILGDFSDTKQSSYSRSRSSATERELSELRDTNYQLSTQLSSARAEINRLKNQNQAQYNQVLLTSERKCSDLEDDYDNIRDDLRDKKNEIIRKQREIRDLEDEIAEKRARGENTAREERELRNLKNEKLDLEDDLDDLENDLDDIRDDLNRYNC